MVDVKLILLNTNEISEKKEEIIKYIGYELSNKAFLQKKENDILLSLGSSYLKKKYIGDYHISEYGKPFSNTLYFSISHSFNFVAIAINNKYQIGLDIEKCNQEIESDVISYCLSNYELSNLDKHDFLSLFVSKESIAKAQGYGLINNIKDIPALPIDGYFNYMEKKYYRKSFSIEDYFFSISLEAEEFNVLIEKLNTIDI